MDKEVLLEINYNTALTSLERNIYFMSLELIRLLGPTMVAS